MSLFTQQLLWSAFFSALVLVGILLSRAGTKRLKAEIALGCDQIGRMLDELRDELHDQLRDRGDRQRS
jgi:hypothetical protein